MVSSGITEKPLEEFHILKYWSRRAYLIKRFPSYGFGRREVLRRPILYDTFDAYHYGRHKD